VVVAGFLGAVRGAGDNNRHIHMSVVDIDSHHRVVAKRI
jgi:hypothetical protein